MPNPGVPSSKTVDETSRVNAERMGNDPLDENEENEPESTRNESKTVEKSNENVENSTESEPNPTEPPPSSQIPFPTHPNTPIDVNELRQSPPVRSHRARRPAGYYRQLHEGFTADNFPDVFIADGGDKLEPGGVEIHPNIS